MRGSEALCLIAQNFHLQDHDIINWVETVHSHAENCPTHMYKLTKNKDKLHIQNIYHLGNECI